MELIQNLSKQSNIEAKILRRIIIILEFALRKKDGSPTSFAEKFNIKSFEDLYEFLKKIKTEFKNDHETEGFYLLTEMWKSVAPRCQYWIMETYELEPRDALFAASVFTMRTFGYMLDNLLLLKSIIKKLDELTVEIKDYVAGEKFSEEDYKDVSSVSH